MILFGFSETDSTQIEKVSLFYEFPIRFGGLQRRLTDTNTRIAVEQAHRGSVECAVHAGREGIHASGVRHVAAEALHLQAIGGRCPQLSDGRLEGILLDVADGHVQRAACSERPARAACTGG